MDKTSYEGTPWECVAWLERYFAIMRRVAEGARDTSDDREFYDQLVETLGKSVYRITVEPLGMVASDETRPENSYTVMRMQTALELFDAIQRRQDRERIQRQQATEIHGDQNSM